MKTAIVIVVIILLLCMVLGILAVVRKGNDESPLPDNSGNIIDDGDSPFFSVPDNSSELAQSNIYLNVVDGEVKNHIVERTWHNDTADIDCADESFEVVPGIYELYVDKGLQIVDYNFTCRGRVSGGNYHFVKVAYLNSNGEILVTQTDLMSGSFASNKTIAIMYGLFDVNRNGNKIMFKFNQSVYGTGVFHSYGEAGDFLVYPFSCSSDGDYYTPSAIFADEGKDDYYILSVTLVNPKNNERYVKHIPLYCVDPDYGKASCPDFSLLKNKIS